MESLKQLRDLLIEGSKDSNGFIDETAILLEFAPYLLETKLIDSDDIEISYFEGGNSKVNGYLENNTGERLQLFIVSDNYNCESLPMISSKSEYLAEFEKVENFYINATNSEDFELQESDPTNNLLKKLRNFEKFHQYDSIDIFLLSLSATIQSRKDEVHTRSLYIPDRKLVSTLNIDTKSLTKEVNISYKLIDLNYIENVANTQSSHYPLRIILSELTKNKVELIKAADEEEFESYLCVFDANLINNLYEKYSTRLLEKNIRSFLQFKGVNKGIKETIKNEPHKFIAYNNGLTITAKSIKTSFIKKKLVLDELSDFQIVNGGQTTASIYFSNKEGLDISKVRVMAKLNIAKNESEDKLEKLISSISQYSNSQSRVSRVDLRSRNPKLITFKTLSETILTPSGKKWFFERAKGELNTLIRKSPSPERLKKTYPKERRFSKELLAKYFCAWGDEPYSVKKGGEAIFRKFIEKIAPSDSEGVEINRAFYEETIAKIMLFRHLEIVYGVGKDSIGQLRSAVVPYSISSIYKFTSIREGYSNFNFEKIWKAESFTKDESIFFESLLTLMNTLIKSCSLSDDYGEYSKKKELWDTVSSSIDLKNLMCNIPKSLIKQH